MWAKDVAVGETKRLQETFQKRVKRLSFDHRFHSPDNQTELSELVEHLCAPKPGSRQSAVQLAILGRNLHTLGRMLIAKQDSQSAAAHSRRKAG